MSTHINQLPTLAMLEVFDCISVYDLLKMDKVCARWKWLQAKALRTRHELTLLVGEPPMDRFEGSVFNLPLLDEVVKDDGTPLLKPPSDGLAWSSLTYEWIDQNTAVWLVENCREMF